MRDIHRDLTIVNNDAQSCKALDTILERICNNY